MVDLEDFQPVGCPTTTNTGGPILSESPALLDMREKFTEQLAAAASAAKASAYAIQTTLDAIPSASRPTPEELAFLNSY